MKWWILAGLWAASLAAALGWGYLHRALETEALERARGLEGELLTAQNVLVADRESAAKRYAAVAATNADLAKQLEAAKKVASQVKIVRVLVAQTPVAPAQAEVKKDDPLFARVTDVGIRTTLGNEAAIGTVEVLKVPDVLVFRQPFDVKASRLTTEPPPSCPETPWALMAVGCAACAAGGAYLGRHL